MSLEVILPLFAAITYCVATLNIKRALEEGAGIMRIFFLMNILTFFLFLPYALFNLEFLDISRWWAPFIASTLHFFAAYFLILAIREGDVSIQTPLMGTKNIFVALGSLILLPQAIPISWWLGAIMAFLAILILGLPELLKKNLSYRAVFYVIIACAGFGIRDVLIEREAPIFGRNAFLLCMFGFIAIECLALIPLFRKGLRDIPKKAWRWIWAGVLLQSFQITLFCLIIGLFGKATIINILYSTRGLWIIVIIWSIGHWFGSHEKHLSKQILIRRMIGAALMFLGIALVAGDL